MATKVYGLMFSPAVRSVLLTANILNLKIEFIEVNLVKGHHLKPAYLKLNPLHTIPTIDDNGFILFDSNAIVTYLVDKYAKDDWLYPKDLETRATVNQRLFFSIVYFTALKDWSAPFRPSNDGIMKPELLPPVQAQFDNFEALLGGNTWIAGTKAPTVADICLLCSTDTAQIFMDHEITSRPKVDGWLKRMRAWAKVNISNYDTVAEEGKNAIFNTFTSGISSKL